MSGARRHALAGSACLYAPSTHAHAKARAFISSYQWIASAAALRSENKERQLVPVAGDGQLQVQDARR